MTKQLRVTQTITNYRSIMSSFNDSVSTGRLHPSFMDFLLQVCLKSRVGVYSITTFSVASVLVLLPLCVFVLLLGLQRRRRRRPGVTTSHSDVFTFHMAVMELLSISGCVFASVGVLTDQPIMVILGTCWVSLHCSGQIVFHILTCLERYLAAVHPVTYLSLRKAKAHRVRRFTLIFAWFHCVSSMGYMFLTDYIFMSIVGSTVPLSFTIICFCSVSVLWALIRPGPGEGGGDRLRADQSKLRAFHTMLSILAVLLLRFGGFLVITSAFPSVGNSEQRCGLWFSDLWFSFPSSLVLPLLFLHRAGKLACRKTDPGPGPGPGPGPHQTRG